MKLFSLCPIAAIIVVIGVNPSDARADITLTMLTAFHRDNGAYPFAGLVQGIDGNFYGTTTSGGAQGTSIDSGTVFKMSPDGTLLTLRSFASDANDLTNNGWYANAGLLQGPDGNLYGATVEGAPGLNGTVFKITTNGALTTLFRFNGTNGAGPASSLVQGSDGNFYGTTPYGGTGFNGIIGGYETGYGTVFRLDAGGGFTNLYFFSGGNDGANPLASLVQGTDGALYGTTMNGGTNGVGTIFRIATNGALASLYAFSGPDGRLPFSALIQAKDGAFYGTTRYGGPGDRGTIFRITASGTLTTLFSFNGTNGGEPTAALLQAADGNLYGTTAVGGAYYTNAIGGYGTLFRMSTEGNLRTLYSFRGDNGAGPFAALVQGADGNFYGTTFEGGYAQLGTVFRLSVPLPPVFKTAAKFGSTLTLVWSAVAGQTYQLQSNSDLSSTNWNNVGGAVAVTNGNGTMTVSDPIGPDSQRFYRVVVGP